MFYVWTAYASISAAIGRRVWLPRPPNVFYPNIYVLLVGNAGEGKSQALGKMRWVIAQAGDIRTSHSVETPEGFIRYIAGNPTKDPPIPSECMEVMKWPDGVLRETHTIMITANEFINFIKTNMESWASFLNDVYDQDVYNYRTKGSGTDIIMGPYITLCGAIPTDVSKKLQDMDIINTGFGRRTLMQHGDRKFNDPVPRPPFNESHLAARTRCVEFLRKLKKLHGPFTETPEAAELYDSWYCDHSRTLAKRSTHATRGWFASKPMQVSKIAMLTCLSEAEDLIITPQHYQMSLDYLEVLEQGLPKVFGGMGRNDLGPIAMKVIECMNEIGEPMTERGIHVKFFHALSAGKGITELREILDFLVGSDQLIKHTFQLPKLKTYETIFLTPTVLAKLRAEGRAPQVGEAPSDSP